MTKWPQRSTSAADAIVRGLGSVGLAAAALFAALPSVEAAVVANYYGGPWSAPTSWPNSIVPTNVDEVWFNTPGTSALIPEGTSVTLDTLVVGRHALETSLTVDGGSLTVGGQDGATNTDVLFVGQYGDASGTVTLDSGSLDVDGELAVGVSGPGTYVQNSGTATVAGDCGRFILGRYGQKPEAVGRAVLRGGTLSCRRFEMSTYSSLDLEGGMLIIEGDQRSRVNGYIDSGLITSGGNGGEILVLYDAVEGRTRVYSFFHSMFDYDGSDASPTPIAWSTPEGWIPHWNNVENPIPTPGSEIWMNQADTCVTIEAGTVATANKLVVARHRPNAELINDGGELIVGNWESDGAVTSSGSILFVGQYPGSSGKLVQKSGTIKVSNELAIAVGGPGIMHHLGGVTNVAGRVVVGRYNTPSAAGHLLLTGGEMTASRLDINDYSTVEIDKGGKLRIKGNVESRVQDFIDAGKITSSGSVEYSYDSGSDQTTVYAWSWDVQGILSFTADEVGPRLPKDYIVRSDSAGALNVRTFKPAPAYGVHPRIFFGPDEVSEVRGRLENTAVGQEVRRSAGQLITLLTEGRAAYETKYATTKKVASGDNIVSNPGLYSTDTSFKQLVAGTTTNVADQTGTHRNALAGVMALLALECLTFPDVAGNGQLATDLAAAMTTWAEWALTLPSDEFGPTAQGHGGNAARDWLGGQHFAFAYDLNHGSMTEAQRESCRKAIAKMIWLEEKFTGITTEGYATTTNHVTINSFVPMMVLSVEGETNDADHGWSTERLETYFHNLMLANYKFYTYGWYAEGAPYEGEGKNYQYNAMMVAYAKRGYNFFTHPHVQSYARDYMPAMLQPHGHFITTYDTIGGTSANNNRGQYVWGEMRYPGNDIIGVKYAYPDDPSVDFSYRQFVETPYVMSDGVTKATVLDVTDSKVTPRNTYKNDMLSLMMFASDYNDGDYEAQNEVAQGGHTFNGKERGLVITQSGFDDRALKLNLHTRQDTGGHTYGDRNSFMLSGLGRNWIRNPVGYMPFTEWQSSILVNGRGIAISDLEGDKARQPGRIVLHVDNDLATFTGGDATYAYNTEWWWSPRANQDSNPSVSGGGNPSWQLQDPPSDAGPWTEVLETWNDFRAPDNQLVEPYGDIPFYDYAHWQRGGTWMEGIKKRQVNDLSQFYRQAGLVRGSHSYALIVDDIHKLTDGSNTEYQWLAQIPEDLVVMPTSSYAGTNLNTNTDIVLMEPSTPPPGAEGKSLGTRRLLVRILNAEGTQPDGLATLIDDVMPGQTRPGKRLVIKRNSERPRFRVMLYPYEEGQDIPQHVTSASGDFLLWSDGQADDITFSVKTKSVGGVQVEFTEIGITRGGQTIVQTTVGDAQPMPFRW